MWNRSKFALLTLASIHVGAASVAMAQENGSKAAAPQAPAGYVLVEEDHWHKLADEPGLHVARAREAFLMKDARTAAHELHKAAVHVRIAAGHAAGLEKNALLRAAHDLEHTAQRLEDGKVASVEEIDVASSRALHALSHYQYVKAEDAWRKREARLAGQYLRSSANNLERAAARTDVAMRTAAANVAKESRLISGKLIEGTGFVVDEVGAGFDSIGHELERVGTRVMPRTASK